MGDKTEDKFWIGTIEDGVTINKKVVPLKMEFDMKGQHK